MTVELVADHSLLLAIPAFFPAIIVAGVIIYVAKKDRGQDDDEDENVSTASGRSNEDGNS